MARQLGEIEAIAALVKAAPPFADVLICPPALLPAGGFDNCFKLE